MTFILWRFNVEVDFKIDFVSQNLVVKVSSGMRNYIPILDDGECQRKSSCAKICGMKVLLSHEKSLVKVTKSVY